MRVGGESVSHCMPQDKFGSINKAWSSCKVVCFDVDSTLSPDEGIDVLASYAGVSDAVAALTSSAMSGSMLFEDSISARLGLIRPTPKLVQECLERHPPRLTTGASELVSALQKRGVRVFLISGGFIDFVNPIAAQLGIPLENVTANKFIFSKANESPGGDDVTFVSLDSSVPTCRTGGKAVAIRAIQERLAKEGVAAAPLAMIGDGMTDLEASPPADLSIGFGGVVFREKVFDKSTFYVSSFQQLTEALGEVEA